MNGCERCGRIDGKVMVCKQSAVNKANSWTMDVRHYACGQ